MTTYREAAYRKAKGRALKALNPIRVGSKAVHAVCEACSVVELEAPGRWLPRWPDGLYVAFAHLAESPRESVIVRYSFLGCGTVVQTHLRKSELELLVAKHKQVAGPSRHGGLIADGFLLPFDEWWVVVRDLVEREGLACR